MCPQLHCGNLGSSGKYVATPMNDNDFYSSLFKEMKWGFGVFDSSGKSLFINPPLQECLSTLRTTALMPVLEDLLGKEDGEHVFAAFRQGKTHHLMRSPREGICRLMLKPLGQRIVLIVFPLGQEGDRLAINEILAELVENAPEPVGIGSDSYRAVYLNKSARKSMGIPPETDPHSLTIPELQPDGIGGMDAIEALTLVKESGAINVSSHVRNITTNESHKIDQTVMAHQHALLGSTYFSTIFRETPDSDECPDSSRSEPLLSLLGEQSRMIRENCDQLYYSREIWRSLVEYNQDLVVVTDQQGVIHYCNRGFLENSTLPLIGLSLPEELAPLPLKEKIQALASRVASGEQMHDSIEAELVLPDGRRFYCLWLASHLKRQDGSGGITWIITDISREHTIRQRSQAMEKFAATGRMAARIAHEFNNPLAGIKGAITLVKMDTPPDTGNHKYLCMVEKEIDRLSGIIRQMYGLYKPENTSASNIDFRTLLTECCFLMQPLGAPRNINIHLGEIPSVTANLPEHYVREIIYNLLRNAIEASYENGDVHVHGELEDGCLHLMIDDQGHGLPENPDANIFEPFYTTKKTFQGAGLGLGLSVCRSLASAIGGSVQLSARESGGVRALACLPLEAVTDGQSICQDL